MEFFGMLDLGAQTDPDGKPGMWEHLRVEYSSFLTNLMSWDDLSDPYPPKYTQNTASPNQLSARKLRHKMSLIFNWNTPLILAVVNTWAPGTPSV